jgi:hypothetical protein
MIPPTDSTLILRIKSLSDVKRYGYFSANKLRARVRLPAYRRGTATPLRDANNPLTFTIAARYTTYLAFLFSLERRSAMARYNTAPVSTGAASALRAVFDSEVMTHTGGKAYTSDSKTELFRLGVSYFVGEKTYHETSDSRGGRFTALVSGLAVTDPDWTFKFLQWLRAEGNIRTASVLGAVTFVHARTSARKTGKTVVEATVTGRGVDRAICDVVCQRLDEVPELFAAWKASFPGESVPIALKRGAADATARLLNEYSFMKYDTASHAWRIGDVLNVTHAAPSADKGSLYRLAIDSRFGNPVTIDADNLPMIFANQKLRKDAATDPSVLLDPARIKAAGMTWEDVLSLAGPSVNKAKLWEAMIPSMGYMALLRNLRNFEEAGISKASMRFVADKLADPNQVARSRQFPFRFWTAHKNTRNLTWGPALSDALDYSVNNIPELDGETLILVDTSGSMQGAMSNNSTMTRVEGAALFASALAQKNAGKVHVHLFATNFAPFTIHKGESVLATTARMNSKAGSVGHGTQTVEALRGTYRDEKRVFIFTDGQSFGSYYGTVESQVPAKTWLYAFDLAGYQKTDIPSGDKRRHQLAGLTDATFRAVPLLERGAEGRWPWE